MTRKPFFQNQFWLKAESKARPVTPAGRDIIGSEYYLRLDAALVRARLAVELALAAASTAVGATLAGTAVATAFTGAASATVACSAIAAAWPVLAFHGARRTSFDVRTIPKRKIRFTQKANPFKTILSLELILLTCHQSDDILILTHIET